MISILLSTTVHFGDSSAAITTMQQYVTPTVHVLAALAGTASIFFLVNGGYLYMTSAGKPETLERAKRVVRSALLGLVIVLAALTITSILSHAYHAAHLPSAAALPSLESVTPKDTGNGLVDVLVKAVIGFLNTIIQAVASPFLAALNYFTKATPLMADNASVFNLWLAVVGISDVLFAVVIALIGLHVMSAASFGFDEIEFKHLLPRIGLIFLLLNTSIFAIDGIIALSNALISAIANVSGASSIWLTLTKVVESAGSQGLAALLLMLAFVIFSVILLIFYVGRLVTLFIGAVLSPLVILIWLLPGFRDFSETAIKTYITTIFTLFVHVVILMLAASLFTGLSASSGNNAPSTLMAMVVGLATILALLKTQGVMLQFSYVSGGARNARMLGGQFMNGIGYMSGFTKQAATKTVAASHRTRTLNAVQAGRKGHSTSYSRAPTNSPGVTITKTKADSTPANQPATPNSTSTNSKDKS